MNFQYIETLSPIKVLVVNPLSPAARLTIVKILSGSVFGSNQLIDLILLVYFNERTSADIFRRELYGCAFSCSNTIEISSDLPNISDADVFCFITNFANPNYIDFDDIDSNDHFDTMYLIIKIANNFSRPVPEPQLDKAIALNKDKAKIQDKPKRPIFVADGLVAIDILHSLSKNLPFDVFFCPTPITTLAKSVLADYLKVKSYMINDVLAWAANDEVFHLEIEKPLIIKDKIGDVGKCYWDMISKDELKSFNMDHTQFNASWLKKDLIEKVVAVSKKNPYGSIFKASKVARALKVVWTTRSKDGIKLNASLGIISNGSLDTIKGCPYVLPLVFCGESWSVNTRFEENYHLRGEIKRINKSVIKHHEKLIPYCKKFLEENVLKQAFVQDDESSAFSLVESQRSSKISE
ncbi:hypothetical protein K1T71_006659 [Dendrolimus kikuchii]|uniref:Uncharacterized protein n=1 Tax=Dendrolimus kikuchii TaxID=765133 RepID=A0ACC1D1S2_9NEOP|nr:hypothetical protein K1T71_006659 [Dendrolimus kikuchii]